MLKLIGSFLILLTLISDFAGSDCFCKKLAKDATTKTGWAEFQIEEAQPFKMIQGKVVDANDSPLAGSYVEVFRISKPDEKSKNKDSSQKRISGCEVGKDGKFCFPELSSGKYQLRVSQDGFSTLLILVEVAPNGVSKDIEALMKLGG